MQRVQPNSNATAITPITITENISCCTSTTKIALAIFVSLAAFVFLPFGVAITLSAIVTLGAICCNDDDSTPDVPPQSQSSAGVSAEGGGPSAVGSRQLFGRIEPTSTAKIMGDILTSDERFAHMSEAQRGAFIGSFHGPSSADNRGAEGTSCSSSANIAAALLPFEIAGRTFCSSPASIALRASGINGDEIPNCLRQNGLSSPSGVGTKVDEVGEDMPDLSAPESPSSAIQANAAERPKPTCITKGEESVALFFETDDDVEAFRIASSNFIGQYKCEYDSDVPILDLNFKGVTDIDTVLDQIKGLYPGESLASIIKT